ncbi:MAG: hypothetical protein ACRD9Q_01490, partial [Nitrososphaeraceae archaeon]
TSHPQVIYMYPNALYAEITYNGTISLVRGHNYPILDISNGFDWINDNSKMEYDTDCKNWQFYEVDNGYMLNCYPENVIKRKPEILMAMNDLFK